MTEIRFKNGTRILVMKVKENFPNGDVRVIDGTIVEKKNIIETIKN